MLKWKAIITDVVKEYKCVRKATLKDIHELAPKMREADKKEILASDNVGPTEALLLPFNFKNAKIYSGIGTKEEGVVCMFGSTPTDNKDFGVAWMLSSEQLFNHKKTFIKECPYWINHMGQGYKYLYNFVDKRNTKALRWLKFIGFNIIEEIPEYGYSKIPFYLVLKEVS